MSDGNPGSPIFGSSWATQHDSKRPVALGDLWFPGEPVRSVNQESKSSSSEENQVKGSRIAES